MHPVLEIPELVEQILGYLDGYDHGRCASVCKTWSEIALDYLWYHVGHHFGAEGDDRPGFVDLARLIAPVKMVISEEVEAYSFESRPGVEAMKRFQLKYSKRIRVLIIDCCHFLQFTALFNDINRIRASSPILPNLHTLRCWNSHKRDGLQDILMFMHNSIQIFSVDASAEGITSAPLLLDFIEATHSRMPRLTSLDLLIVSEGIKEEEFVQLVTRLIKNLPLLSRVRLPSFQDITPILSSMSRSSVLQNLTFNYSRSEIISSMRNPWSEGEVASLEELKIARILDSQTITPLIPHLRHLKVLHISFTKDTQPKSFFDAVSQHCSALSELRVSYERQILEFDDFGAILACKNITRFHLNSVYHIHLSDTDLTRVALAWPQIEMLQFSGHEQIPEDLLPSSIRKKISSWAVFILTRLCPNLKDLRLHINTVRDTPPIDVSSLPPGFQETRRVANLERMDFGYPVMTLESGDEYMLSDLLGKILPAQCRLSWTTTGLEDEEEEEQSRKWETVENLFPRFAKLYSMINLQNERIALLESFQSTHI